jgi:hypothetical protein
MEVLLFGALTAILAEVAKVVIKKVKNQELATSIIYIGTFCLALVAGALYFYAKLKLSPEMLAQIATIWGISIGFYETAIKRVINPILTKILPK